ncbi:CoA transferase [Nocardioides sp. 503]|uniref:CaiB/BaiF CoA transferase family protein n=1 Tax=Nocardioides sp. 503 TaxID=2508326 RepID=UPI00106FEE41|nr:CoA transferase [Nocardioides sp. 503]
MAQQSPATAPATPTTERPSAEFRPLEGLRVLDFTRVLAGPYATMTLAELGADVVKIEMPGVGDETRAWGPPFVDDSSAYFHAINRGKRSVVLDLTTEEGREHAYGLMATADIVVENFRPGVTHRLGIDPELVTARFPHLVYASITGFGTDGPMADHPGTEVIIEAESGLMGVTGIDGGEPVRFGVAMVDIATGLAMINGILAALLERTSTGRGRRVDVSLYATAVSALGTVIASTSAGGGTPRAWGSAHPSIVPYRAFAAADGHVVLGATNDAMFQRLQTALDLDEVLGREAWQGNAGRVSERDELEAAVQERVAGLSLAEVLERLRRHRVLVAPVLMPHDAARSAQATALDLVDDDDGVLITRSPLSTNGTRRLGRAPALGEHTAEILAELDATTAHQGKDTADVD